MYQRILAATDGSLLGELAVHHARRLAHRLGAELIVLTATEPVVMVGIGVSLIVGSEPSRALLQERDEAARKVLSDSALAAEADGVACRTVLASGRRPAEAILETANTMGADLIVMASHGRRGFQQWVLGSQTSEVLARTPVPVLVVR